MDGGRKMINYKMNYLMSGDDTIISVKNAQEITNLSKEVLFSEIKKINAIALRMQLPKLLVQKSKIIIPKEVSKKWLDIWYEKKEEEIYYSENERQLMIYLLVFMELEEYSVFHFQEFFLVSKNTILSDLRKLRKKIETENITLDYSRKLGFTLRGNEYAIRSLAYQQLTKLLYLKNGMRLLQKALFKNANQLYPQTKDSFIQTIKKANLLLVPSRFEEMLYFTTCLLCRITNHEVIINQKDQHFLQKLTVYKASQLFLSPYTATKNKTHECLYFTIILMTVIQGENQDRALAFLWKCAHEIIHEVERLAAIEFQNNQKLLKNLFYHLVPSYFRLRFQIPLSNVLVDKIKLEYRELFEITKAALVPLKKIVGGIIPEEEIGYFTILFGGEIKCQRERKAEKVIKALVLCPSGISSSLIMKSELQALFPQICFFEAKSFETFSKEGSDERVDLIFSSTPIKTNKKLYLVNPIMTQFEKNRLLRKVQEDFLFPKVLIPSVDKIIDILAPHIELKKGKTKEKLYEIVERKINQEMRRKEDKRPMLSELLTPEMIQLSDEPMSWEEAIELSAKPLEKNQQIEGNYIAAMIDKVKDYGPFIHIGKGVALPHARPEDGVKRLGMSLLKVKQPILLLDDEKHAIQIFICLAAIDNEVHLKALASLTKILSNNEKLTSLLSADSVEKIYQVIKEGEEK